MTLRSLALPRSSALCSQCRSRLLNAPILSTPFGVTVRSLATSQRSHADPSPSYESSGRSLGSNFYSALSNPRGQTDILSGLSSLQLQSTRLTYRPPPKPHHLHVYATRHNCHITLTNGKRGAVISVSCGNLNFRKSARGTYDAAFQLGAFVLAKIKNMGLLDDRYPGKGGPIKALELVLRDFGPGREAVTKLLMGQEGKELRQKITRVMDGTRLKFGGTRSKKPRRLG